MKTLGADSKTCEQLTSESDDKGLTQTCQTNQPNQLPFKQRLPANIRNLESMQELEHQPLYAAATPCSSAATHSSVPCRLSFPGGAQFWARSSRDSRQHWANSSGSNARGIHTLSLSVQTQACCYSCQVAEMIASRFPLGFWAAFLLIFVNSLGYACTQQIHTGGVSLARSLPDLLDMLFCSSFQIKNKPSPALLQQACTALRRSPPVSAGIFHRSLHAEPCACILPAARTAP